MHQRPLVEAAGKLLDRPQRPSWPCSRLFALFSLPVAQRIIIKMIRSASPTSTPELFACVCLQTSVDAEPLKLHGRVTPVNDESEWPIENSHPHLTFSTGATRGPPCQMRIFALSLPLFKAFHCLGVFNKQTGLRRCVYWSFRFHLDIIQVLKSSFECKS